MKNNKLDCNDFIPKFVYSLCLILITITVIIVIFSSTFLSLHKELDLFSIHEEQVFLQNGYAQYPLNQNITTSRSELLDSELDEDALLEIKLQSSLSLKQPLLPPQSSSFQIANSTTKTYTDIDKTMSEVIPDVNFSEMKGPGSKLKLAMSKIVIDIPMQKGYENGNEIFLVTFDSSDNILSHQLTKHNREFPIHHTKVLKQTPLAALNEAYIFKNGLTGKGHLGFQPTVLTEKPGDTSYSSLKHVNFVEWLNQSKVTELKSEQEILSAQRAGELRVNNTTPDLTINSPAIKWKGDSLKIRSDKIIYDDTPFVGGQVTNVDTTEMVVTMVAMRGFGPDGTTIYWLVTDATPMTDDIIKGGIVYSPANELLSYTPVAVDFYQFINGIKDGGPQGFQPPISPVNLEDPNYSPMWRILFVAWKDPQKAQVLQTMSDLNQIRKEGLIEITPVFNGKHIVNCPFFDQSTVLKFLHMYDQKPMSKTT
ncbi:MAG: hypothetical protein MRJ93_08775 [Nitrososphaeraceae archaeon]|nr:hypothetical protein [Nitrososphaeraceae archaeon]